MRFIDAIIPEPKGFQSGRTAIRPGTLSVLHYKGQIGRTGSGRPPGLFELPDPRLPKLDRPRCPFQNRIWGDDNCGTNAENTPANPHLWLCGITLEKALCARA